MKRHISISLVSLLVLAGCETITETYESAPAQLEVTSSAVIFDAGGGSKTVLVTSSSDWTYDCNADWFGVVPGDGSLEIRAEANPGSEVRSGLVTITAGTAGELSVTVSVSQLKDSEYTDLSETETANCYIAHTGSSYCFNATVKGNGHGTDIGGVGAYAEKYGVDIDPDDIVYADLLWEAVLNGDKTTSHDVMDGNPVYGDGLVYFTTGTVEGNAVVAVKDAQGTVLWSWHIWVTDAEIGETYGNGYYWMDRNLGAVSTEPGDINTRGLLYQWGRKDPFLPSCSPYGADEPDAANTQVGDGSGEWHYTDFYTKTASQAPGNIPLSVQNPMKVLLSNGLLAWYLTKSNDDNNYSYLWGNSDTMSKYVKSLFDPCPAGYNVPVENPWMSDTDDDINVWEADEGGFGRYWTGGGRAYYPLTGEILGNTGAVSNTSVYGRYWTSGMFPELSYTTTFMYFNTYNKLVFAVSYPAHAFAVRCMRID